MGFKSVYRTLIELFPQVDARLLKAAAIEHSKDPDEAVMFILTEVAPYATKQFNHSSSKSERLGSPPPAELGPSTCTSALKHGSTYHTGKAADEPGKTNVTCRTDLIYLKKTVPGSAELTFSDTNGIVDQIGGKTSTVELTQQEAPIVANSEVPDLEFYTTSDSHKPGEFVDHGVHAQRYVEDTTEFQKDGDYGIADVGYSSASPPAANEDAVPNLCPNEKQPVEHESLNEPLSASLNGAVLLEVQKEQSTVSSDSLFGSNHADLASLSIEDHSVEPLDCCIQSEVHSNMHVSNLEIPEYNGTAGGASKEEIRAPDDVSSDESSSVHAVVTRSGQHCSTDLLEELIEDSKSHKKMLFSAMESVLKLMREVELEEKAALQANEEAIKGGLEILARVDGLKSMLKHAREANDTHSGEVYGERAILSTEMRELQSRLLGLSDEKDKSISMLDAMQQALETRLAVAESERKAAELIRLEKEECARKELAEQELIMEKVVQESKMLQREAEKNAKLREFLVDRGRVVDTLQGEISVICQDVELLKEKFDSASSLSECLSSKHTSCVLASSRSSVKSTGSDKAVELLKRCTSEPTLLPSTGKVGAASYEDELLDDGWDLFDDAV